MVGHDPAKITMAELMLRGTPWAEAARQAGVVTSQTSAYRFVTMYCLYGEKALEDGRHGHAHKLVGDVLVWLLEECREHPEITALEVRAKLEERFHVRVTKRSINRVRAAHGLSRPKKKRASARVNGRTAREA
jgi:transposase